MANDGSVSVIIQQQAIDNIAKANKALEQSLKLILDINKASRGGSASGTSPADAEKVNAANRAATQRLKIADQTLVMQKKLLQSEINLKNALSKENAELEKNRFELQRRKSILRDEIKANSALVGAYEKLTLKLKKLKKDYKDVAAAEGVASKGARKLKVDLDKLDKQVRRVEQSAGEFGRTVGNYPKQMGAAVRGFRALASALGVVGGLFLAIRIARDTFNRIRQFDKAMQNIAGILGTTRKELVGLEKEIIKVAGSSIKTSNEVAELAEALITLGKSKSEVIGLLQSVNDLSVGLEATSEEAGQLLIKTLNAFGQGSEEANRFAQIIAKMRTSTALDFEQIKDSLSFVAPTAKALGLTFEETGALLGVLVDNGIRASRAGRLLSSSFARLNQKGITFKESLDLINESTNKTKTATELYGVQSFTLGLILSDNIDKTAALTKEFENAEGTLDSLINQQLKSLDAQLKILDSTWEKFILNIEKGDGAMSKFFKSQITQIIDIINVFDRWNKTQEDLFDEAKTRGYNDRMKNARDNYELFISGLSEDIDKPTFLDELNFDLERTVDNTQIIIGWRKTLKDIEEELSNSFLGFNKKELEARQANAKAVLLELNLKQGNRDALIELIESQKELNKVTPGGGGEDVSGNDAVKKVIEGTVAAMKEQISTMTTLRDSTATTKEEYDALTRQIELAKKALEDFQRVAPPIAAGKTPELSAIIGGITGNVDTPRAPNVRVAANAGNLGVAQDINEVLDSQALDSSLQVFDQLSDIGNMLLDGKIALIDAEIQAEEDKYTRLFELAQGNENQQRLLAIEREENLQKLEEKRKKEQKKQAIFNKAVALADIGIKLAQTIAAINLAAANLNAVSLGTAGTIFAAVQIPLAIGIAAAQTAAVLATPIPQFAKGGTMDHDGLAVVGDGGRKEVIKNPDGSIQVTPSTSTLVNLKKGAEIFPSIEDAPSDITDKIYSATVMASLSINNSQMKGYLETQKIFNDKLLDAMLENTKAVKKSKSNVYLKQQRVDMQQELFKLKYLS